MSTFSRECNQFLYFILDYAWNDVVSNDREAYPTSETNTDRKKKNDKLKVGQRTKIFFNPVENSKHILRLQFFTEARMNVKVK